MSAIRECDRCGKQAKAKDIPVSWVTVDLTPGDKPGQTERPKRTTRELCDTCTVDLRALLEPLAREEPS